MYDVPLQYKLDKHLLTMQGQLNILIQFSLVYFSGKEMPHTHHKSYIGHELYSPFYNNSIVYYLMNMCRRYNKAYEMLLCTWFFPLSHRQLIKVLETLT